MILVPKWKLRRELKDAKVEIERVRAALDHEISEHRKTQSNLAKSTSDLHTYRERCWDAGQILSQGITPSIRKRNASALTDNETTVVNIHLDKDAIANAVRKDGRRRGDEKD